MVFVFFVPDCWYAFIDVNISGRHRWLYGIHVLLRQAAARHTNIQNINTAQRDVKSSHMASAFSCVASWPHCSSVKQ